MLIPDVSVELILARAALGTVGAVASLNCSIVSELMSNIRS